MDKIKLKICVLALCLSVKYCFAAVDLTCSFDPGGAVVNDMGWHIVTVTAGKTGNSKFTIGNITSRITNLSSIRAGLPPEVKPVWEDINCTGKKFEKVGDFCRFKTRLPYPTTAPQITDKRLRVSFMFADGDSTEEHSCDQEYYVRKDGFSPVARLAVAEEYKIYPALANAGRNYIALVIENGGKEGLNLVNFGLTKLSSSPWLKIDHRIKRDNDDDIKNDNDGEPYEDPLYGKNKECGTNTTDGKINRLDVLGDSCIVVYHYDNIPSLATTVPSLTVTTKPAQGKEDKKEVKLTSILKPMKLALGTVYDIGINRVFDAIGAYGSSSYGSIPPTVLYLQNYYSTVPVKVNISIRDSIGNDVSKFFDIRYDKDCPPEDPDCAGCLLSSKASSCHFFVIAKQKVLGDAQWGDYLVPSGKSYTITASTPDGATDSKQFRVLAQKDIEEAIRQRMNLEVDHKEGVK